MHPESPAPASSALLWQQFQDGLRRFVATRVPSEADADDVLQEIYLRIHRGAAQVDHDERVAGWIFTVARRTIADFYRSRYQRNEAALEEAEAEVPAPDGNLAAYSGPHDVHEEVLSWIRPMVEELPEPYRSALRMADLEHRTQQEIADAFDLSLSGAKSRVQRARRMLGETLKECCDIAFGPDGRAVEFRRRSERCRTDC